MRGGRTLKQYHLDVLGFDGSNHLRGHGVETQSVGGTLHVGWNRAFDGYSFDSIAASMYDATLQWRLGETPT